MSLNRFLSAILLIVFLICCSSPPDQNTHQIQTYRSTRVDSGTSERNWNQYPAIVDVPSRPDILALGDIHGDYDRLIALLTGTKVLKISAGQVEWNAGSAVLVCTGDMIDKWNQAIPVIDLLQRLQTQATAAGGQVIVTMGNHEAEFLANPENSKASEFVGELTLSGILPVDVASGRHPIGQYLRSLPFAARVGPWFFAHAGHTSGRTLPQLASDLQTGVEQQGFGAPVLLDDNSLLEARLSPAPWWENGPNPEQVLTTYTKALGVDHIVMGHQPGKVNFSDGVTRKKGAIFQKFGRIFLIDTGMSQGVDYSQGALLRIHRAGNQTIVTALYPNGQEDPVWSGG